MLFGLVSLVKIGWDRGRTGEGRANLLDVEGVVLLEDEWHGAELEVQNSPAEGDPEGEEEDDRLGNEHIYRRQYQYSNRAK